MSGRRLTSGLICGSLTVLVAVAVRAQRPEPPVVAEYGGVRAFRARRAGKAMKFEKSNEKGTARDTQTGSSWNLERGAAVSGELAGERLEEIPVTLAFWFAWSSFYPNTEVL